MPEEKPIVYILRGDDREKIEALIRKFYNELGPPDQAEMNTTRLEGKSADLNDLRAAALALPFLSARRLVILEDALQPYMGGGKQKLRTQLLEVLEGLPPTTALVAVVPDFQKYSRYDGWVWNTFHGGHWFVKWASTAGKRAMIIDCALPTADKMPTWIQNKAQEMGGQFSEGAATLLRDYIGNNTQETLLEITKLLTYVNFSRPVEEEDVRSLTVCDYQSDIFTLVDAIGNRKGKEALEKLHILLDEMDFIPLFGMVIRQFRLLIQARELLDMGRTERDLITGLRLHAFVASKIYAQAQKFDLPTLEGIYLHLLEIDIGHKNGSMPGEVALDLLIARLAS